jgi:SulP family sulfate permease
MAVALVGYIESLAVAKSEAERLGYEVDPNQEMIANGAANLGAGLSQGFAVNGSLSKSAAGETAGGKT